MAVRSMRIRRMDETDTSRVEEPKDENGGEIYKGMF
jgi:hypothetical protein